MISAQEALQRLQTGNQQFVDSLEHNSDSPVHQVPRPKLVAVQEPIAVILGCSDARVPAEIVFNQQLGELFVIRVAGNIVAPSLTGSVEFAVEAFGTPLVVVMGHTQCGAVAATYDALTGAGKADTKNLQSIVNRVRPAMQGLLETDLRHDPQALKRQAVRNNVRISANQLRNSTQLLEGKIQGGELLIVGAEYSLETGKVDFFDGMP